MFGSVIHRYIYIFGLALMVVSLPFSPFFLSLGQFIVVGNWLVELKFIEKWKTIKANHAILLFTGIFFVHVFWLLNTDNFDYALHDIKIKLPLLALPILLGTTSALKIRELKLLLHLFISAILVSTLISTSVYFGAGGSEIIDSRNISLFISHIRFALMLNLAVFIIISFLLRSSHYCIVHPVWYSGVLVWLLIYQILLGAFSGVAIFFLTLPVVGLYWLRNQKNQLARKIGQTTIILTVILMLLYPFYCAYRFYDRDPVNWDDLPNYTENGNRYKHYPNDNTYENSTRIWILVSEQELLEEWNKRSDFNYKGKDEKGQNIRATLIRYLASLGYSKDSAGVAMLTEADVRLIEKGFTNHIYKQKWALYPRIYELLWEIEHYMNDGNPSGHSLTLRFELVKNGVEVFKRFKWFGTGTGDINDEILLQYKLSNTKLESNWQFRPHNQYITFLATFGIIGFSVLVFVFMRGLYLRRHYIDLTSLALLAILFLSMLSEDTFETQAGATFFALFISLLFLSRSNKTI